MTRSKKGALAAPEPWGLPLHGLYVLLLVALGMGLSKLVGVFGLPTTTDLSDPLQSLPVALAWLVAALGAAAIVLRLEKRPLRELGFSFHDGMYIHLTYGFALATGLGLLAWAGPYLAGSYVSVRASVALVDVGREGSRAVLLLGTLAAAEEAVFRGVLQRFLARRLSVPQAIFCSSVIFALAHGVANPAAPLVGLLGVAIAGAMLGLAYARTGSLWLATGLHLGWNLAVGFVAGLPVSGQSLAESIFHTNAVGSSLLTGGSYGPEASVVGLVLLAFGILAVRYLPVTPAPAPPETAPVSGPA